MRKNSEEAAIPEKEAVTANTDSYPITESRTSRIMRGGSVDLRLAGT